MRNIITIAKREFWSFINTPVAYIVTIAFIIPSYFLFWRQTLITGEASLRNYFSLMPWFLILVVPALTMKALSEEQKKNTLDILLSHALHEWEIVFGKFLGVLSFYTTILFITLSLPATLLHWSHPDLGIIAGQYIGIFFTGTAMIALGLLVSTWFKQAITAFLVTAGILFGWLIIGLDLVTLALPSPFNQIAYQLSLLTHSDQLARGLIELRDISYFTIITLVILSLASIKLSETKLIENRTKKNHLYIGAILITGLGIILHLVLTNWPIRIDLTKNHMFTLSKGTKTTLSELPDIVTINLYASENLPAQVQPVKQQIDDTLKDYARFGNGKIKIATQNPDNDPQISQQAISEGIQQIQFNTIANSKFSIEAGFLGIVIRYGNQTETIPYIQNPGNLEYELTQKIRKLTIKNRPTISFLNSPETESTSKNLQAWDKNIQSQFQTSTITLDNPDSQINSNVLIIAEPTSTTANATASAKVKDYLNNQGKVLFLLDGVQVNTQLGIATALNHGWSEILKEYGLTLNPDMAYDVQRNENIRIGQDLIQYIVPYPYWIRSMPADTSSTNIKIPDGVLLGWPSSISIDSPPPDGVTTETLLTTSINGGTTKDNLNIAPESTPKQGQSTKVPLAVSAQKDNSRIVLIGDSDLAQNNFYQNSPANQAFLNNIIDWLVADETLAQVPQRITVPNLLNIKSPKDSLIMEYGNVIGVPVLIALFGIWWLNKRNKLTQRKYSS